MRDFSLKDFSDEDLAFISERAMSEARQIKTNKSEQKRPGGPRSLDKIYEAAYRGHAAEYFLMKEFSFIDNPAPYKDLFEPDGVTPVEIKVTGYDEKYILKDCKKYRNESYRDFPNTVYIFRDSRYNDHYKFVGKFVWNGFKYEV